MLRLALAREPGSGQILHFFRYRIDANDGVQTSIGDPRRDVRPDYHAMWRRALAKRNPLDLPGLRIKSPKHTCTLTCVPDGAVRRRCDVVWVIPSRHGKIFLFHRLGRNREEEHPTGE